MEFALDVGERRGFEATGGASQFRGDGDVGPGAGFDQESARGDHGGEFSASELAEEAEGVAIDGFLPDVDAGVEGAGDGRDADAGVDGGGFEGDEAALSVAEDSDFPGLRYFPAVLVPPVDQREDLLNLVAGERPAQFVGRALEELAVCELCAAVAGLDVAIDESGDEDPAAVLGEPNCDLPVGRNSGQQPGELLGCLVGVGQDDDIGQELRAVVLVREGGEEDQSLAGRVAERGPEDRHAVGRIEEKAPGDTPDIVRQGGGCLGSDALVAHAEDVLEVLAVGRDGLLVVLARGSVSVPEGRSFFGGFGGFAKEEAIDAVDHRGGEVALVGEGFGAGKRLGLGGTRGQGHQADQQKNAGKQGESHDVVLGSGPHCSTLRDPKLSPRRACRKGSSNGASRGSKVDRADFESHFFKKTAQSITNVVLTNSIFRLNNIL